MRIVIPTSPAVPLPKTPGTKLPIVVSTVPHDAPVNWTWSGDDLGEVVQLSPDDFEYRRGSSATDEVLIKFQLAREPSVVAELKVLPPTEPATEGEQPPQPVFVPD